MRCRVPASRLRALAAGAGRRAAFSFAESDYIESSRLRGWDTMASSTEGSGTLRAAVGVPGVNQVAYVLIWLTLAMTVGVPEKDRHSTERSAMGQHMSNLHTLGTPGIRS